MALKLLYHEGALSDLEETFEWSRERHPETTEQFANDLFDRLELLRSLPYIGTPIKDTRNFGGSSILRCMPTTASTRAEA